MIDYSEIFKKKLRNSGDFQECYAFSIHKCGSTLMHKMINQVCHEAKVPAVSIPDVLFIEGVPTEDWDADPDLVEFIGPGRIYFGFRHLPDFLLEPRIDLYGKRAVLLVRDPRDALVSAYFSFGGKHISHKLPEKNKEEFLARYMKTADLDIDQYVLQSARNHRNKLIKYKESLDFDKVLLRRYEDIYFDKRKFLEEIFDHFEIEISGDIIQRVATANDERPAEEDITKHIRKGTPGDHREKLRPETITALNNLFREISGWYGYQF